MKHFVPMKTFNFTVMFLIVTKLMLSNSPCHADVNANTGQQCSEVDYSATENGFQTNLNSVLNSLLVNGALQNGFYKTTAGKKANKVYGLIQCRGDISGNSCASCTNNSITAALHDCPKSKEVWIWFTWCLLHYSTEDIFGVMVGTSVALLNETDYDDPAFFFKWTFPHEWTCIYCSKTAFDVPGLSDGCWTKREEVWHGSVH